MLSLSNNNQADAIEAFISTPRYLDVLLNMYKPILNKRYYLLNLNQRICICFNNKIFIKCASSYNHCNTFSDDL